MTRLYITSSLIQRINSKNNLEFKSNKSKEYIENYVKKVRILGGKVTIINKQELKKYARDSLWSVDVRERREILESLGDSYDIFDTNDTKDTEDTEVLIITELQNTTTLLSEYQISIFTGVYLFEYSEFKEINLEGLNTDKVTNMSSMFHYSMTKKVNFGNINTSNVKSMVRMFFSSKIYELEGFEKLDFSSLNNAWRAFEGCTIKELDLSGIKDSYLKNSTDKEYLSGILKNCKINTLRIGKSLIDIIESKKDLDRRNIDNIEIVEFN